MTLATNPTPETAGDIEDAVAGLLGAVVEKVRPLSDAHFADRRHSHGE